MIKEESREINGAKYSVQQFAARRGLKIKTKLIKLIAPTAFAAIGGVKSKNGNVLDADINAEALTKAIQGLVDNFGENEVINLIFEILSNTRRDGVEVTSEGGVLFDDIYAANYGELFEAIMFVIEVNYSSFFQKIGIGNLKLQKTQPKPTRSRKPALQS